MHMCLTVRFLFIEVPISNKLKFHEFISTSNDKHLIALPTAIIWAAVEIKYGLWGVQENVRENSSTWVPEADWGYSW